jgi:hypothetical protein
VRSSIDSLPQSAKGRFEALVSEGHPTGVGRELPVRVLLLVSNPSQSA